MQYLFSKVGLERSLGDFIVLKLGWGLLRHEVDNQDNESNKSTSATAFEPTIIYVFLFFPLPNYVNRLAII